MRTTVENYVRGNKIVPIEFTNLHKAKLYEMCCNIIDNNNTSINISLDKDIIRIPKQDTDSKSYNEVHWFELCTTHLCFHVCNDPIAFIKHTIDYSMLENKGGKKHPIDYLYDEYDVIKDMFRDVFNFNRIKTNSLKNLKLI